MKIYLFLSALVLGLAANAFTCPVKRYVSTATQKIYHDRCVREHTFGLDDVVKLFSSDDDDDPPETVDVDIYNEARNEAKKESLDCDESNNRAIAGLFSACNSASKFVKVKNQNKYRCTIVAGNLFMYISTFGSPEELSRVYAVGFDAEKRPEIKFSCGN